MPGGECCLCGACGYVELHHVIFRSQSTYMKNIKVNLVQLCQECHRCSTNGVHHNKKLDLKLKLQLQTKLQTMFINKFYSKEEIQTSLQCTDFDTTLIVKKLTCYVKGYEREQIIRRLLGGRTY